MPHDDHPQKPTTETGEERRRFLSNASRAAMVAGLVGGYGGFAAVAGRFLYPSRTDESVWQFVSEVAGLEVGESIRYRGPSGEAKHSHETGCVHSAFG